jgi:hypothetical protein
MKKLITVIVLGLFCSMIFASCKDSETCDAYDAGSIQTESQEDLAKK